MATPKPPTLDLEDLRYVLEALDKIAEEAQGIGTLTDALITIDVDGARVVARWDATTWKVTIK